MSTKDINLPYALYEKSNSSIQMEDARWLRYQINVLNGGKIIKAGSFSTIIRKTLGVLHKTSKTNTLLPQGSEKQETCSPSNITHSPNWWVLMQKDNNMKAAPLTWRKINHSCKQERQLLCAVLDIKSNVTSSKHRVVHVLLNNHFYFPINLSQLAI